MLSLRRNLGRLTVLGDLFSNSIYTNYTTKTTTSRKIKSSYAFPTIFNSFNAPSSYGGYTECEHYHSEAETVGESDRTFVRSITKGDTICLNDLLFTNNRDYLVRNNGQHVKAEQLEGKVIGIYFVPLFAKDPPQYSAWYTTLLKEVYYDLHLFNNFETVLVACEKTEEIPVRLSLPSDSQKVYEDLFSYMPWTAIPFSDVTSRKHMQRSFGVPQHFVFQPFMYIVDQTGMVLQCDSWDILEYYGSSGYPFSDKRLKYLRTEDYLATQQPSLRALLGNPQRDYVISNNGERYPFTLLKIRL